MSKISWCKKQAKGIKLIEPNQNLCKEYYGNAEESLNVLRSINETKSNMWLATTKYYIEYFAVFAVYSILMRIGIKCEIHDCTIALIEFLEEKAVFKKGIADMLEKDKELRIDNQYYLKNKPVNIDFEGLSQFLISIKTCLNELDDNKIKEIRESLQKAWTVASKDMKKLQQTSKKMPRMNLTTKTLN